MNTVWCSEAVRGKLSCTEIYLCCVLFQVVHIMNTAFHQLQDLIAHLKEIIVLREKYNLRLSLLEYSKVTS